MSNKQNEKGIKAYTSHPWELLNTGFLVLTWIILGTHLELVGPTIKVLARQTKATYSEISTILMTRSAGYMTGNIAGALAQKFVKQHSELLLSLAFVIASAAVVSTPFIYDLYLLSTVSFLHGISQGTTDLGGTSLMLVMWGDKVSAPLSIVHLGYGFGAVFAGILAKPFLDEDKDLLLNNSTATKEKMGPNEYSVSMKIETSNIRVPYSITSCLCLIIAIGHLIFAFCEHQRRQKALQDRQVNYASVSTSGVDGKEETRAKNIFRHSPRSCGNGSFIYGLSMSIIWIFYMFFLSGNDQTFGKFFFAFLKSSNLAISTGAATSGTIIYWLSYSTGRLILAIVTIFVPVHIALGGLWVFGFTLAVAWYIFVWVVNVTSTNLLVLGALTGLVFSPTFPLSFGFINQRLNVNPLLVGLLLCGVALGAMSFQKLGGIVLDYNYKHFPSLLITCVVLAGILFIMAFTISSIHQRRLSSKANSAKNSNDQHFSNTNEEEQQLESYLTKDEQEKL